MTLKEKMQQLKEYRTRDGSSGRIYSQETRLEEGGCGCGCPSCSGGNHHGGKPHNKFDEYGAADGPEDLDDDGELSACELKHHFDLNGDGVVTPDEYAAHVKWHCRHPEVLDQMVADYEEVQDHIYDEEDEYDYEPEEYYDDKEGYYELEESKVLSLSKLLVEKKKKTKKDRCYRLAKQKYDVFPSAYASGFIVRCRKGKFAKKKK
jgi:hypothetical protein